MEKNIALKFNKMLKPTEKISSTHTHSLKNGLDAFLTQRNNNK